MRLMSWIAAGTAMAALTMGTGALATESVAAPVVDPAPDDIIVTARQREEALKDVPIAVTVLTGADLKDRQVNTVKDIAAYTPGLNINADSVGRAFVSIRGVGTTLIDTVQPGVGIFIDGIYQPNTSYLNSPIVDVARIEVLRGPQGTLFGNNTLGGAINVITRQPGNDWTGRFDAAIAGPDNYASVSGSVSGPIVKNLLQFRIGASYHVQDGFQKNWLALGDQNPLEQKSIGGTLRFLPAPWASLTINASYDRVFGGNTGYFGVTGPTDYRLDGRTNQRSLATITYKAVNAKGEFDMDSLRTRITAIAAYNQRDAASAGDADYNPIDFFRSNSASRIITKTGELRFDTKWSEAFSTLIGVFANEAVTKTAATTTIAFLGGLKSPSSSFVQNRSDAIFGTAFLKLDPTLDLAIGGRYDHQTLKGVQTATSGTFVATDYRRNQFQPRVTLTKHWSPDFMTYASVAKGVRGGGQNGPGAPNLIYKGDSVWTYELGTKFSAIDRRLSINADIFYNDYDDFIGQNSLAPSTILNPVTHQPVGFVAVNLNTGHVESYGAEIEAHLRVTDHWRIDGGATLLHARITDDSDYVAITGMHVSSNRIIFTPDWNFNASTTYTVPIRGDALVFDAGVVGKGSRVGSSLDPAVSPRLSPYYLVNGSIAYKFGIGFEVAAFATNLLNEKYVESYIDKSALVRAGLAALAQNLAIQGDRRRYGMRASFRF